LNGLRKNGKDEWRLRDCDELSEQISDHYGLPIDMSSKTGGLRGITNALNEGDVARAQIGRLPLGLPVNRIPNCSRETARGVASER
jgi:hypothetical protein